MRTWRDGDGTLHRIPPMPQDAAPSYHPRGLDIIKLPFQNTGTVSIPGFTVNTISINNSTTNPYTFPAGTTGPVINFIPETGELVFSEGARLAFDQLRAPVLSTMAPTAPAPPNPADFSGFDAQFLADWGQYEALLSGIPSIQSDSAALADRVQYLIQQGHNPTMPTFPTMPTPPPPTGGVNWGVYFGQFSAYIGNMNNFNDDFSDYLDAWEALGPPPLPSTVTPPTPPTPRPDAPTFTASGATYTHPNLDPNFVADFDAFMVSFNHYLNDMAKQHTIMQQNWDQAQSNLHQRGVNIQYSVQGLFMGELNPRVFFDTVDFNWPVLDANGDPTGQFQRFSQDNQDMRFELGTNTRMTINTQARNAYPWQLFADLRTFIDLVDRVQLGDFTAMSPEDRAVAEAEERTLFAEGLYQKFTNMITLLERHMQTSTTEFTALGSRMNRVDLIATRLDENEDTFMALMSQNENVDYIEALMRFNAAEAVMQAAMQVGARIAQVSLVNFI